MRDARGGARVRERSRATCSASLPRVIDGRARSGAHVSRRALGLSVAGRDGRRVRRGRRKHRDRRRYSARAAPRSRASKARRASTSAACGSSNATVRAIRRRASELDAVRARRRARARGPARRAGGRRARRRRRHRDDARRRRARRSNRTTQRAFTARGSAIDAVQELVQRSREPLARRAEEARRARPAPCGRDRRRRAARRVRARLVRKSELIVSDRGVRWGLAEELASSAEHKCSGGGAPADWPSCLIAKNSASAGLLLKRLERRSKHTGIHALEPSHASLGTRARLTHRER